MKQKITLLLLVFAALATSPALASYQTWGG